MSQNEMIVYISLLQLPSP